MDRKSFIRSLMAIQAASTMKLKNLYAFTSELNNSDQMPLLFLGHGNPMNAIEENEFVRGFREIGKTIPRPSAILCISAHWETRGTFVTAMEHPPTIHDFGGFPKALFDVQYPAPGSPELAGETKKIITKADVVLDDQWGLDHGAWSVIKHLYPMADVPVIQMSLDRYQTPRYHYELAKQLSGLRRKGVLIIGSGNMVHNLGLVAWDKLNETGYAYDWALEASSAIKSFIQEDKHDLLIDFRSRGKAFDLAIPTPEHYLPLLYTLALKEDHDEMVFFNDQPVAGSLTMTSVRFGK